MTGHPLTDLLDREPVVVTAGAGLYSPAPAVTTTGSRSSRSVSG